ncbi:MAG TPA: zinc ribbon domain-containing protein [Armatimonadetes bacterium]|nr:zinc ribbon domain-containing protein [Armatimonadota bacterium]
MSLLEDVRRGAQVAVREAQRLAKIGQLRLSISALENKIGDKVYELGLRALELHRRNELHHYELDDIFAELAALQRELREREEELEHLSPRWREERRPFWEEGEEGAGLEYCPKCGARTNPADRFCRSCGARLEE